MAWYVTAIIKAEDFSTSHAAQIGLYTDMHFQIWCNLCKFVGFIYIKI